MKKFVRGVWCAVVLSGLVGGPLGAQTSNDPNRFDRLDRLGRLWGTVSLLHPNEDRVAAIWDSAMMAHIPALEAADGSEEWSDALSDLLEVLGDPATRVIGVSATEAEGVPDEETFGFDWSLDSDGLLLIRMNDYGELGWDETVPVRLAEALAAVPDSRGVIFDLRVLRPSPDIGAGVIEYLFGAVAADSVLASEGLTLPGERRRIHYGLVGDGTFSNGVFYSTYLQDPERPTRGAAADPPPVVFLVDERSGLPALAETLTRFGRASVVAEGGIPPGNAMTQTLDMGEGVRVVVRLSQSVLGGEPHVVLPDLLLPRNADPEAAVDVVLDRFDELVASAAASESPSFPEAEHAPSMTEAPGPASTTTESLYPPREARILAAFKIWNYVDRFFAYPELMDRPWDPALREFLPLFDSAETAEEYALAALGMAARLQDGHAQLQGGAVTEYFGSAVPPVEVRRIDGRYVITSVRPGFEEETQVRPGDVIVSVDGRPVEDRVEEIRPYLGASTAEALDYYTAVRLLSGPPETSVEIVVEGAGSSRSAHRLDRSPDHRRWSSRVGPVVQVLEGNIGYVDLDRLERFDVESMLEQIRDTRAVIFDMRGYPRGTLWAIAPYLGLKPGEAMSYLAVPVVEAIQEPWIVEIGMRRETLTVMEGEPAPWVYGGRTVMLIDERSQSQAEQTALAFHSASGTTFIGSPTAGANGNVTRFELPGRLRMLFSGMVVRWPDGTQLQREGVQPDIPVRPTPEGLRMGRDEVMETALRYLREELENDDSTPRGGGLNGGSRQ